MQQHEMMLWLGFIAGGFLLGSCMFSQILPKLFLDRDISALSDDGNPGCTNVFKHCGPFWGMLCLSLDLLKGFVPVFLAARLLPTDNLLFAFVMAAPVLGHAIAPLNHFRGGKCIAASFGVLLGLLPQSPIVFLLAGIYLLFSTVLKIQPNRIRSMVTFSLFGAGALLMLGGQDQDALALGCVLVAATAVWKHSRREECRAFHAVR